MSEELRDGGGRRRDGATPETPFDFYLDAWNPLATQFQAAGEVVLVRLPFGFYGGVVIGQRDPWAKVTESFRAKSVR